MAIEYLDAVAEGTNQDWAASAGNKYDCVQKDSGDAAYIHNGEQNRQDFTVEDPAYYVAQVATLRVDLRNKYDADATGGTSYTNDGASDYTETFAFNAAWGVDETDHTTNTTWTDTKVKAMQMGVKGNANNLVYVSEMYVYLDYTAGGGVTCFIEWIPPLLAVGHLFGQNLLSEEVRLWNWLEKFYRHKKVAFPSWRYKEEELYLRDTLLIRPVYSC